MKHNHISGEAAAGKKPAPKTRRKKPLEILDAEPPNSPDIERAALACILTSALPVALPAMELVAEDFYDDRHRLIYASVAKVHEEHCTNDIVLVAEQAKADGITLAELATIAASVANGTSGKIYADQLRLLTQKRRTRETALQLLQLSNSDSSHADYAAQVAQRVSGLADVTAAPGPRGDTLQPIVRCMGDIPMRTVRWLREGWYPLGTYTDVSGDPGTGKSQLLCELSAEVIRDGGKVLILSAEDSCESTLRPRLLAVGANCQSVHELSLVRTGEDGEPKPINLAGHIDAFRLAVESVRPRLVWVDTLDAHAGGVNMNSNTDVRSYLTPLVKLAEQYEFALVGIRHWNKKSGLSALYKGSGSVAIVGAARSAIVVAPHPSEPEHFVMASAKLNIGKRPTSRAYRIESATVYGDDGEPIPTSRVVWAGDVQIGADELSDQRPERGGKCDDCADMIRDLLATGPMLATDLEKEITAADYSKSTYRRACKKVGVGRGKDVFQGPSMAFIKDAQPPL